MRGEIGAVVGAVPALLMSGMKSRRRCIFVVVLALLFAVAAAPAGAALSITGTERLVTSAEYDQFDPAIDGNLVVYTDFSAYDADIWYTDLSTGLPHSVSTASGDQQLTGVSDGHIVFTDWAMLDVLVFDVATGMTENLTNAARSVSIDPAISHDLVAWTDSRDGNREIYARDLTTGEERRISNSALIDQAPAVRDGVIAWQCCDSYTCDIFVYEWATGTTRQLTASPWANDRRPDVFGRTVVFQREQGTPAEMDLVAYDLDTGTEKVLALPGYQENPHISGDFVSYNDLEYDYTSVPHIGLWHLPTGAHFAVTSGAAGQYLNDIDGNRIVYADYRSDNQLDIYLYEFTLRDMNPPVANAGPDQSVRPGNRVDLDGSGSSDPDDDYPLTYAWQLLSKPPGSQAVLAGAETGTPFFTADMVGDYRLSLVVTDATGSSSAADEVVISTYNTPPIADAGPDRAVTAIGTTVQLDGSGSWDPDGDTIGYLWEIISAPAGSTAWDYVYGPETPLATFVPDIYGTYVIGLGVHDPYGWSNEADTVTVSFDNLPPVANAGGNQSVPVSTTVALDGSASTDPNGDPLTYRWAIVSAPSGSTAAIAEPAAKQTSIEPDLPGDYVVSLVVNDGLADSAPSNATIRATAATSTIIEVLRQAMEEINLAPDAAFKNPNNKNALTNKINAVIAMVEAGDYAAAYDKLVNDLIPKTDGCALAGKPDKVDWITTCVVQSEVYPSLTRARDLLAQLI